MQHFNEMAKVWETPEKISLYKEYAKKVQTKLSQKNHQNILEIGCGTGLLGQHFINEKTLYLGLDTSSEMLKVLKEKFPNFSQVHVLNLNLEEENLPQTYESFDLVLSAMCFHHLRNPKNYLKKLKQNLSSKAEIVVIDLLQEDGSFHPDPKNMGVHHFGFSKEDLKSWGEGENLQLKEFEIIHQIEKNDKIYPIFMGIFNIF